MMVTGLTYPSGSEPRRIEKQTAASVLLGEYGGSPDNNSIVTHSQLPEAAIQAPGVEMVSVLR